MFQKNVLVIFLLLSCVGLLGGCSTSSSPGAGQIVRDSHERLNGILWIQTSAEYEVLAQTLFASAKLALDHALDDTSLSAALEQKDDYQSLPPAIVVDIDETILDNSPFSGRLVKDGVDTTMVFGPNGRNKVQLPQFQVQ